MIHKLALAVGGLAAAGILAVALGAAGFAPGAAVTKAADDTVTQAAASQAPQTKIVTDTVYVKPTPKQRVIHVKKPAVSSSQRQRVVKVVRKAPAGEREGSEHDGEGNGDD